MRTGDFYTGRLTDTFGLTRIGASRILSRYREARPDALTYNASKKRYVKSDDWQPEFVDKHECGRVLDAAEFLFTVNENQKL